MNVFICGENKCDCDSNGKPMLILGAFSTVEDTPENREIYKDDITGGSVSCSKCGQSAFGKSIWELQ